MGVLIIVGAAALVWIIVHRIMHPHAEGVVPHSTASIAAPSSAMAAVLTMPRHGDEQIRAVVPRSDGTLAVTVVSPRGGGRIVVWLPEQARLVAEFRLGSDLP